MKKQMVVAAVLIGVAGVSHARATSNRVVGVIARVGGTATPEFQVASKGAETRTVQTDAKTAYMKWVTHKPWQTDTGMTTSALIAGRCVEVELQAESSILAKAVRISDEPAGSIFDPCLQRR